MNRSTRAGLFRCTLSAMSLLVCAATAHAQFDSPAAREARSALREVRARFGSVRGWATWSQRLALEDIEYELQLGDRAEPTLFQSTAEKIRAGAKTDFRATSLQKLAGALEKRAAELQPISPDGWQAECARLAETPQAVGARDVQAARVELLARLNDVEQLYPAIARQGDAWRAFLYWPQTRNLVYTDAREADLLDKLDARWQGAPSVWDVPQMVEASLAVQSYLRLYRRYLANESAEQHRTAWNDLGQLLAGELAQGAETAARIAELIHLRERLGEGTRLTASIRRQYSRPNIVLYARTAWLEKELSQEFNERYRVNDVYAGARTVGNGTLAGTLRCEFLPGTAVGRARFVLDAMSRARTNGSSEGVSVSSTATTRVHGEQRLTLDAQGLSTSAPAVTADTSIVYNNIDAPGLRRRRSEAVRRTHARRGQAEADAEAATRREIAARMGAEGNELVARFNRSYGELRDRQFALGRPAPEVRVRTDKDSLSWECRLESPALFAAPAAPPERDPTAEVTLCIAASALEEQALSSLAGREMTGAKLSETIGELFGAPPDAPPPRGGDFNAKFAARPCEIQMAGGQIRAKFYITSFDSEDVQYPAMTVDAEYNVVPRQGDLALVRQGSLRVRPLAERGETPATLSGRQQTLRLAVQRKLNKALAETYIWSSPGLPGAPKEQPKLRIQSAQVDNGWLRLALGTKPIEDAPRVTAVEW
ncbi:MAG: hypothetical protein AB7O59_08745 [Pirellulales bacterium]